MVRGTISSLAVIIVILQTIFYMVEIEGCPSPKTVRLTRRGPSEYAPGIGEACNAGSEIRCEEDLRCDQQGWLIFSSVVGHLCRKIRN